MHTSYRLLVFLTVFCLPGIDSLSLSARYRRAHKISSSQFMSSKRSIQSERRTTTMHHYRYYQCSDLRSFRRCRVHLYASQSSEPPTKDDNNDNDDDGGIVIARQNNEEIQNLLDFDFDDEMDELDDETMEEIRKGQPSEWNIMKELLGINIFTFLLAGLITFFFGMNYFLGPGWLGNTIGIPGTGQFTEVSPSIPGTIDLNSPEYRL